MVFFRSKRKHSRIFMSLPVRVEGHGIQCEASTLEIGGGGMALAGAEQLAVSMPVRVTLTLPPESEIRLEAVVWWKQGKRVGLRFDPADANRVLVERFVAEQVEAGG